MSRLDGQPSMRRPPRLLLEFPNGATYRLVHVEPDPDEDYDKSMDCEACAFHRGVDCSCPLQEARDICLPCDGRRWVRLWTDQEYEEYLERRDQFARMRSK